MTTTPQNLASKVLSRNTATMAATAIAILADARKPPRTIASAAPIARMTARMLTIRSVVARSIE